MASISKWVAGAQAYSATNLADNTAMASRSASYYNICQVSAADVVIDNATNNDLYLGIIIVLGSWTPAVTDTIELYTAYAADGTNYETASSSYLPEADRLWKTKILSSDTSAAAKRLFVFGEILPFKLKMLWRWRGTNATASSGNSMSWLTTNINLNG